MTDRFPPAARWLRDQHRAGARFVPFAADAGAATLPDAYSLQEAHVAAMRADGLGAIRGWKIGLTSARMQAMCGIDQPVAGAVLDSRLHASGAGVKAADHGRLGLEFEICLRLGADLPPRDAPYTAAEVAAAVDAAAAAVEMVDDRNCDYATLDVQSLIADNSWNAGVVLGDWAPLPAELNDCEGVVTLNGAHLDRGFGRDALGGPLVPLEWLANHLSARGRGLRRGDLVMTGSLIPTQFPTAGSRYGFAVQGIGSVALDIM
ncbi:2-keto-4-pentenoate hydratase [Gemmobacter sp.]|uniref:2-keto-4-pentenoate hydratase n=1 Tax=Gemmobacter sp. TaxID=1898957 RepID=UPI002AFFC6A7|nr:fumarylacetoacetate hydrolase family protein [Gemmobacter sp.]